MSLWQCFHFQLFGCTLLKKGDWAKWSDLISQQTADKSTPPSAEGPRGLGEWRCVARFRTTTWQVPGSVGFVRSKRETKHHLWNGILIDCCPHYRAGVLKLFRVCGKERSREAGEGERWGGRRDKEFTKLHRVHEAPQSKAQKSWCLFRKTGDLKFHIHVNVAHLFAGKNALHSPDLEWYHSVNCGFCSWLWGATKEFCKATQGALFSTQSHVPWLNL